VRIWWPWKWPWVAVRCHDTNLATIRKLAKLFIQKWRPVIRKCHDPCPNIMFCCCCALPSCSAANFLMSGHERSQNGRGFQWRWPLRFGGTWQHWFRVKTWWKRRRPRHHSSFIFCWAYQAGCWWARWAGASWAHPSPPPLPLLCHLHE